jgi:Holliday junction resolvase RusA-like endonuclease
MVEFKIVPVPKPRMVRSDRWRKRPCINHYWAFKDELVRQAKKVKFVLGDRYGVTFFLPMPDGWSKKRRESFLGHPHQQKPDLDNLCKSVQDCLKVNDAVIYEIEAQKLWWNEGKIIFYELRKV